MLKGYYIGPHMSTFSFGIIHVDSCVDLCYPLVAGYHSIPKMSMVIIPQVILDLWCGLVLDLGSALCCLVFRPRGEGVDLCKLLL